MLAVKHLRVAYGRRGEAVQGADLRVGAGGAVTVLLGPNGAGKSTLLRAISGTLRHHGARTTAGSIEFAGRDVTSWPAPRRVRAGLVQVPEGRRVFATMTVEENLKAGSFGAGSRHKASAALERVYDMFPILADRRAQRGNLLSGGEQQVLAIGRAMMADPQVLLLDEPSLGLAPKVVHQLVDVTRSLADSGVSILLVEQNAELAFAVADHAYVLDAGNVVASGPATSIRDTDFIKELYLGTSRTRSRSSSGATTTARSVPAAGS